MEVLRDRFGSGLSWLRSHGANFNSSLLFDSLAMPFADNQFSTSSDTTERRPLQPDERVIYVDTHGRELSQGEVEEYNRATFNESPWGFVASRYALTLGIMAIVVNRITHICRPQGRPRPLPRARRLALQLPALFFLAYSGLILLLVTLHSFFPEHPSIGDVASFLKMPRDTQVLVRASVHSEGDIHQANAALLWRLFLSVCFAVVSSTLVRTLEGNNSSLMVHPDDLSNSPTFNLVGFAVLLHLHASSYSYPPNKHVYLSILFQVAEVFGVQACTCWLQQPPISRLALTSFFGITSTIHFLLALRSGERGYPFLQTFSRAPDVALMAIIFLTVFLHALTAAITDTPLSFSRLMDPRSLPSATDDYSLALFKIGTACLSSTRLSGMDSDLIDISTGTEIWVEVEGSRVRVKDPRGFDLTSSLTADGRGGLSREIRKIKTSRQALQRGTSHSVGYFTSPRWREASKFGTLLIKTLQAIGRIALRKVLDMLPFNLPPIPLWAQRLPRRVRLLWHGTRGEERRQTRIEEARRRAEVQRQRMESDRLFRERAEANVQARSSTYATGSSSAINSSLSTHLRNRALSPSTESTATPWQRFFSQEFKDDEDDDDEWKDEEEESSLPSPQGDYWSSLDRGSVLRSVPPDENGDEDDEGEEDGDDDDDDDDDVEGEALDGEGDISSELLSLARVDFAEEGNGSSSYTNVLMAHLARQGEGALTRRGFQRIMGGQSRAEEEAQHLIDLVQQRRAPGATSTADFSERERMRLCVICYIEDRTIICWPCKCLALCEGCREAMATRPPPRSHAHNTNAHGDQAASSSPTHTCPTCRTPVIGYSRLFLP